MADPINPIFEGEAWERYKKFLVSKEAAGKSVTDYSLDYFNPGGYYGIYQFGVQALETIGRLKPGSYKKTKGKNGKSQKEIMEDPANWNDGYSLEEFKTQTAQDDALREFTKRNYRSIRMPLQNAGITNQDEIFAYLTSAHLGGAGTTRSFIKEGKTNFRDANGTSPAYYRDSYLKSIQKNSLKQERQSMIPGLQKEYLESMKERDAVSHTARYREAGLDPYIATPGTIRDTIDTDKSTLSDFDNDMIDVAINNYIRNPGKQPDNQYDATAMAMYQSAMKQGAKALARNTVLDTPDITTEATLEESNTQFAEGGSLNGPGDPPKKNITDIEVPDDYKMTQEWIDKFWEDKADTYVEDKIYKPLVDRLDDIAGKKIDENGNSGFDAKKLKEINPRSYVNIRGLLNNVDSTEKGDIRTVPPKDEYLEALGDRIKNLSDEDIKNIISIDWKGINLMNAYPRLKKALPKDMSLREAWHHYKQLKKYIDAGYTFKEGGYLQPNGNRTKFRRPEDIAAQQNTMAYAEGGYLTEDPPSKREAINVYTYNPAISQAKYNKASKALRKNYKKINGQWHDVTFTNEFNRGQNTLRDQYNKVNHIPIYEPNQLQDRIREGKAKDIMFMDHSGSRIFGAQPIAIGNALTDAQVENCYAGSCHGENFVDDLGNSSDNTTIYATRAEDKWEGFNPGKSGVDALFPKGYVKYKAGKKID